MRTIIFIGALIWSGLALAHAPGKDCSLIPDSTKRLSCFDKVYKLAIDEQEQKKRDALNAASKALKKLEEENKAKLKASEEALAKSDKARGIESRYTVGKWKVVKGKDPLSDKPEIFLSNSAVSASSCRHSRLAHNITIRCTKNTTAILLDFGGCIVGSRRQHIGYRLDDRKAIYKRVSPSGDSKALGFWNGGQSIPVIKEMLQKNKLLIVAETYNQVPLTSTYDLTGLDEAIRPLRKMCSW